MGRIRYLEPMYGFDAAHQHIAVSEAAESTLTKMAADLVGTDDLIAIYIPEGTDDVFHAGAKKGRVVGAVRLRPMPPGKSIRDYSYANWDGTPRWPIGWPCQVVYAPPVDKCPVLRSLVELMPGGQHFQSYVARLQYGPFELEPKMARMLEERLHVFPKLA